MLDNNENEIKNENNSSESNDFSQANDNISLNDDDHLDTSNSNIEDRDVKSIDESYNHSGDNHLEGNPLEDNLLETNNDLLADLNRLTNVDAADIQPPYISDINDSNIREIDEQTTPIPNYAYNINEEIRSNQNYQTPNAPIGNLPANVNNNINSNPYHFNISNNKNIQQEINKKNKSKNIIIGVITVIVIAVVAVSLGISIYNDFIKNNKGDDKLPVTSDPEENHVVIDETEELKGSLPATEIYKKVSPSVIGIQAYLEGVIMSEGSGVIMSADGKIMTNSHVVYGADTIKVSLLNGSSYSAKLLGADQSTDLAVIELLDFKESDAIPVAEFGDSKNLLIGDRVFAIGNPGGMDFAGSLTQGIISNVNRKVSDQMGFSIRAIQVDAAINPGNSGGALINGEGQVIGITSSKIAGASYEGMGFAIPIHEATPIVNDLINKGRVTGRPKIGITYIPGDFIDTKTAKEYNIKTGIRIYEIDEQSDAYKKGLRVNDIIHKIDGQILQHVDDLSTFMEGKVAGDPLEFTIFRKLKNEKAEELVISIILDEDMS